MKKAMEIKNLSISITSTSETDVTLHLDGKLETDNSPAFLKYLMNTIATLTPGSSLVLNMNKLLYASSTGIGSFATALIQCKKNNVKLTILDIPPQIKDVMDLLGFSSFFEFRISQ